MSNPGVFLSVANENYEHDLWVESFDKAGIKWSVEKAGMFDPVFQCGDYEEIDFDRLQQNKGYSACTYVYRKNIIRKHYLTNTIQHYVAKHPESVLKTAYPESFLLECDFAEFLDDALYESYELRQELEEDPNAVWILKPGMSDRAQGIRVFRGGIEGLQSVFDELEGDDHEDGGLVGQLRHFIVQRYLENPLLLKNGRKFHIRTYVMCLGAIKVYVSSEMLALFAGSKFDVDSTDLDGHLTNTCAQGDTDADDIVFRLSDLECSGDQFSKIRSGINAIVADLFDAATSDRINFQPLPNALEVYGLDFLIDEDFNCHLLEVNAYPDFKQTGDELKDVVGGFLDGVVEVGVKSLLDKTEPPTKSSNGFLKQVYSQDIYK